MSQDSLCDSDTGGGREQTRDVSEDEDYAGYYSVLSDQEKNRVLEEDSDSEDCDSVPGVGGAETDHVASD